MNNETPKVTNGTMYQFRAFCIPMIIYSILVLLFVVVAMAGIPLPLDAQTFESVGSVKICSVIAGVLGIIGGFAGLKAVKNQSAGALKFCAFLGAIMIVLFCAMMFLSDGHTNPHAWVLLGSTSIIPACFAGLAIRLATRGWDD